jgi:hypothetical protein
VDTQLPVRIPQPVIKPHEPVALVTLVRVRDALRRLP